MLTRWNPFNELWGFDEPWGGARFQPAVDVREDENMVNLKVELPGVKPEDIKVEVHGNTLTISGERSMEKEDEAGGYRHVERRYGSFTRSFTLPDTIESDKIDAQLEHGVLALRLPKSPKARPRAISVKSAGAEKRSVPTQTTEGGNGGGKRPEGAPPERR